MISKENNKNRKIVNGKYFLMNNRRSATDRKSSEYFRHLFISNLSKKEESFNILEYSASLLRFFPIFSEFDL